MRNLTQIWKSYHCVMVACCAGVVPLDHVCVSPTEAHRTISQTSSCWCCTCHTRIAYLYAWSICPMMCLYMNHHVAPCHATLYHQLTRSMRVLPWTSLHLGVVVHLDVTCLHTNLMHFMRAVPMVTYACLHEQMHKRMVHLRSYSQTLVLYAMCVTYRSGHSCPCSIIKISTRII